MVNKEWVTSKAIRCYKRSGSDQIIGFAGIPKNDTCIAYKCNVTPKPSVQNVWCVCAAIVAYKNG